VSEGRSASARDPAAAPTPAESAARAVYVDLDDVLAHSIEGLVGLLGRHHGRRVDVEEVAHFDLGRSFSLDDAALERFFDRAHSAAELAALAPVADASRTLHAWRASGWRVHVVTGRPPTCAEASRAWLATHDMAHDALHFVDKYGRPAEPVDGVPFEPLESVLEMSFAWAVEDSLEMALRLAGEAEMRVALVDRPWNRALPDLPDPVARRIVRCHDWTEIDRALTSDGDPPS
jgi:uncharacterized HAD superfamily protein